MAKRVLFRVKLLTPDQRIVRAALGVVFLSLLVVSLFYNPETYHLLTCQFKNLTGLPCPSCGLTRSFHAMAKVQIADAFSFNAMGPVLYFLLLFFGMIFILAAIFGKIVLIPNHTKIMKWAGLVVILLWGAFWLADIFQT